MKGELVGLLNGEKGGIGDTLRDTDSNVSRKLGRVKRDCWDFGRSWQKQIELPVYSLGSKELIVGSVTKLYRRLHPICLMYRYIPGHLLSRNKRMIAKIIRLQATPMTAMEPGESLERSESKGKMGAVGGKMRVVEGKMGVVEEKMGVVEGEMGAVEGEIEVIEGAMVCDGVLAGAVVSTAVVEEPV